MDMVGNVEECVAEWGTAASGAISPAGAMLAWDGGSGSDYNGNMWNVSGTVYSTIMGSWIGEVPAIARGGSYLQGSESGVFAFSVFDVPSDVRDGMGFRCGRRR